MRTSLNEIRRIEDHLLLKQTEEDQLLFQASVIIDKAFAEKVELQKQVMKLVKIYGRNQLKKELDCVHHQLFNSTENKTFKERIISFFKK